jgi:hypothetical protein
LLHEHRKRRRCAAQRTCLRRFKREILDQKLGKCKDFQSRLHVSRNHTAPRKSVHTRFGAEPS